MNRNLITMALAVVCTVMLSACPKPGHGRAWYNVYGDSCSGPRPGCNFYKNGGVLDKINLTQDPFYESDYTGLDWDIWYYNDSFGDPRSYIGFAWESPNGIIYDSFGSALNNASESEVSPDVIGDVAAAEEAEVQQAGHLFAERHALAEDAGVKIARSLNHWANIGKTRERTNADLEYVSKQLFGFNVAKMEKAYKNMEAGDASLANSMTIDVAKSWGTTPETTRDILKAWYAE